MGFEENDLAREHLMSNSEDLTDIVKKIDQCWVEGRFDALTEFLDEHIMVVRPDGVLQSQGRTTTITSYREFMSRCSVSDFQYGAFRTTKRDQVAIVEYDWRMTWNDGVKTINAKGRECLALRLSENKWRVFWRMQLVM